MPSPASRARRYSWRLPARRLKRAGTATGTGDAPGILRIDFPGYGEDDALHEISWDDFFRKFDEKRLAFLYQDHLKDGSPSRFSKFVNRDS